MSVTLSVLCENSVARPGRLIGEHGFACLIEAGGQSWLFDTGQGLGLLPNAGEMKKNLRTVAGVILSHGHYDHSGGLFPLLNSFQGQELPVYAHPDIFTSRFWRSNYEQRDIGMPVERSALEASGGVFRLSSEPSWLDESLCLSGEVPRVTSFETGDPHLVVRCDGEYVPDPLRDDQSLAITTERGLIILLGCAHAGVINILEHFIRLTGEDRILALVGGTHLGPLSDDQYHATLKALRPYHIGKIGVSHCTGLSRSVHLFAEYPGHCFFAAVGSVMTF